MPQKPTNIDRYVSKRTALRFAKELIDIISESPDKQLFHLRVDMKMWNSDWEDTVRPKKKAPCRPKTKTNT